MAGCVACACVLQGMQVRLLKAVFPEGSDREQFVSFNFLDVAKADEVGTQGARPSRRGHVACHVTLHVTW